MKSNVVVLIFVIGILVSSCKDNTASPPVPPPTGEFAVRISVKNTSGSPMAGIRISAWNHLSIDALGKRNAITDKENFFPLATTTIQFSAPTQSMITLAIFNLDGTLASKLIDQQLMHAGFYSVFWRYNEQKGTAVFKYRLVAAEFQDSLYAVVWQPDYEMSIIGWTSQSGTFETKDTLLFPNVLKLPPLIRTSGSGPEPIDTFSIKDTVTIYLTDTLTRKTQSYQRVVRKGVFNDIQLTWNPSMTKPWGKTSNEKKFQILEIQQKSLDSIPTSFRLYQNYPNPFN